MIFASPWGNLALAPAVLLLGCTHPPAQFETSVAAPAQSGASSSAESRVLVPALGQQQAVLAREVLDQRVREFFLALQLHDAKKIESLMDGVALLKSEGDDQYRPLSAAERENEAALSPQSSMMVVSLQHSGSPFQVEAVVAGANEVRGTWRFTMRTRAPHRIVEIVLPEH